MEHQTTKHGVAPAHHAGHADHAAQFRERFWWSLGLSVPVVAFSGMFADLVGYTRPAGTGWISPVFGIAVFAYGGVPFLKGAAHEIRARQPGMMLLIGLAITVAFTASLATSLHVSSFDLDFWWELALLIDVMLLGHWLEMKAIGQAQGALAALAALLPDDAERVTETGDVETVPIDALRPRRSRPRAQRRPRPRRRRHHRRRGRGRRVDGDRRITARPKARRRPRRSRAPSRPIRRSASGSPQLATTPRSPASNASSKKPKRRGRAHKRSPTAPPRSCSTSQPARRS